MSRIIKEIDLSVERRGQGKTRHFSRGEYVSEEVASLQVVQFAEDSGFYVLYLDVDKLELNDLYFDTLAAAKEHLEWEFNIRIVLEG